MGLAAAGPLPPAFAQADPAGSPPPAPVPAASPQPGTSPEPGATPQPGASPAARVLDEIPDSYRRILETLRARREEELPPGGLRFGRSDTPDWNTLRVREIRTTARGLALVLEDDAKEYVVNDVVRGRRLAALSAEEATFEHAGEQRRIKLKRALPTLAVRAIKQVEGEWAAFMEGERRPLYPGDVVRGARIVAVAPDGVTFQLGQETKKISPRPVKQPFPALAFNGTIDMTAGRVVLIKGRPDPVKVGDVVDGARIVEISSTGVSVEYQGEKRTFPSR